MPDRRSEYMSDRMAENRCQIAWHNKCENICQVECQNVWQIEYGGIWQTEGQMDCQNICQIDWQNICQIECLTRCQVQWQVKKMSEYLSKYASWNVMVGITRSEVIENRWLISLIPSHRLVCMISSDFCALWFLYWGIPIYLKRTATWKGSRWSGRT